MSLSTAWEKTYTDIGLTKRDALDDLNKAVGRTYDYDALSRWRSGERRPRKEVVDIMLRRVVPILIRKCCPEASARDIRQVVEALIWWSSGNKKGS